MTSYGSLSPAVFPVFFNCKLIQPGTIVYSIYTETRYSGTPFLAATILTLLTTKKKIAVICYFCPPPAPCYTPKVRETVRVSLDLHLFFLLLQSILLAWRRGIKVSIISVLSFLHLNQVQVNHMCKCGFYCSVEKCTVKHNLIFGTLFHLLARNILLNVKTITKYLAQAVAKVTWAERQSNTVYMQ